MSPPEQGPQQINGSEPLPKMLPGTVHPCYVRCGKATCRCAQGQLHGPYFYRYWRERGKLKKQYVPRGEVDRIRRLCEARRCQDDLHQAAWAEWRQARTIIQELEPQ
jgi:hypothetical protein